MNRAIVSYYLLWCFVVVVVFNLASGLSANKAVSPESLLAEETSALRDRNAILFFFLLSSEPYVNFAESSILKVALPEELAHPPVVKLHCYLFFIP